MSRTNGQRPPWRFRMLCRHCEDGGDPRQPGCVWDLHRLCDPINEFCACPCDTGELDHTRETS